MDNKDKTEHDKRLDALERKHNEILAMAKVNSELISDLKVKNNEPIFLFVIGFCFTVVLLVTFALTWFGVIDLRIVGQIEYSYPVEYIGNLILFFFHLLFLICFTFKAFSPKTVLMAFGYSPIWILCGYLGIGQTLYTSALFPFVYILMFTLLENRYNTYSCILLLAANIIQPIFQLITGFIKLGNMNFAYYACNTLTMFIYSIDLYLFYIYTYRVVKKYGTRKNLVRWAGLAREACREILKNRELEDVSALNKRQRHIFFVLAWGYLILQSFMVIGLNVIINKLFHYLGGFYIGAIELIIAFVSLELCRLALGRTYHNKNPIACNAISLIAYFVMSRLFLPLHISLFYNIIVTGVLAYAMNILVLRNDMFNDLKTYKQQREQYKAKTRRGKAAIVLELLPLNHPEYQILQEYVNGETLEILADRYNLSPSTLNRKINALTQK